MTVLAYRQGLSGYLGAQQQAAAADLAGCELLRCVGSLTLDQNFKLVQASCAAPAAAALTL